MSGLIGLLVLAVLAVPVLLVIALVLVAGLRRRVASLESQVAVLAARAASASGDADASEGAPTLQEWMRARAGSPSVAQAPESTPVAPAASTAVGAEAPTPTPSGRAVFDMPPGPTSARAAGCPVVPA